MSADIKTCKLKVKMMSPDISQLRFDFVHFSMVSVSESGERPDWCMPTMILQFIFRVNRIDGQVTVMAIYFHCSVDPAVNSNFAAKTMDNTVSSWRMWKWMESRWCMILWFFSLLRCAKWEITGWWGDRCRRCGDEFYQFVGCVTFLGNTNIADSIQPTGASWMFTIFHRQRRHHSGKFLC